MANIVLQPIDAAHPFYAYAESLMLHAFPEGERRAAVEQRRILAEENRFACLAPLVAGRPVGLLTCWNFGDFVFWEHLAVDAAMRGQGIGAAIVALAIGQADAPVLIEVEEPVSKIARRRVSFYERCGFALWECDYRQPPYSPGGPWLPMRLMATPGLDPGQADELALILRREVYGVEE